MTKADGPFNFSFLAHYAFLLLPFSHTFCGIGKRVFLLALGTGGKGGKEERIFQCGKKRGKGKKKKKKKSAHEDEMLAGKSGFFGFFFASAAALRTPVAREASEGE